MYNGLFIYNSIVIILECVLASRRHLDESITHQKNTPFLYVVFSSSESSVFPSERKGSSCLCANQSSPLCYKSRTEKLQSW
jgi:hypothetical protein